MSGDGIDGFPPHIRVAGPADADALYDILCAAHDENAVFTFSETKVRAYIADAVARNAALAVVIDGDDEIAAVLALVLETWWYSDDWSLGERVLYVRPQYRHSKHATDLIEVGQAISDRWGVAYQMGVMTLDRLEAKMRLYRQRMTMVGGYFMHGLDRANGPLGMRMADIEAVSKAARRGE